jgi:hypothetical protein
MNVFKRPLTVVAAALTTAAIAVPAASAQAAILPSFNPAALGFPALGWGTALNGAPWGALPAIPLGAPPATPLGALPATPLSFVGPSLGQLAVVIGPTINTTSIGPGSGVSFINTNNQVSAGSPVAGSLVSG